VGNSETACRNRFSLSLSYVCPEPVLANGSLSSVAYVKTAQKRRFAHLGRNCEERCRDGAEVWREHEDEGCMNSVVKVRALCPVVLLAHVPAG